MKYFARLVQVLRRAFSPKVEESIRLRVLGLAFLWLAALGLLWAGGSLWMTLGGAALGTGGHLVSWQRRHRRSRLWPLAIAVLVISLSFLMRSQMLEAFTGNWLPLGQFLVLVQALSSFDVRTRGGLYTGLAISGIILFFASQQAFSANFIIFVIGFVVLLLAFLAVSFLEDGVRSAQVYWKRHQASVVTFWIGSACLIFLLAGVTFWIMPRGESQLGLPQVAILPFSSNSLDASSVPKEIDPAGLPELREQESEVPALGQGIPSRPFPTAVDTELEASQSSDGLSGRIPANAFLGNASGPDADGDVAFFVRSKVASYWRGRTLAVFDGRYWRTGNVPEALTRSRFSPQVWYDQESFGLDNRLGYSQTFFIKRDQPDVVFTGYRGVRFIAEEGSLLGAGVRAGDSYRVLSAHPRHSIEQLRQGQAGWAGYRYLVLPPDSERIRQLARRIGQDAGSDFAKVERIIAYLAQEPEYDPRRPGDLTSSASLDQFLFEGKPGSPLDYATATVMLARASDLPARLALGYLPGVRDPLSGAYLVRESDAHAWAEVFFEGQGWVPVDTAPRPDISLLYNTDAGVGYLFGGGFGEKAYQAVKATPSKVAEALAELLDNRVLGALGGILFLMGAVALGWRRFRWTKRRRRDGPPEGLAYERLSGQGRLELLRLYARAEKLLRRRGATRRMPWQTVGEYAGLAASEMPQARPQLGWFTRVAWQAAYNPGPLPRGVVSEAQKRLQRLKAALRGGRRLEL